MFKLFGLSLCPLKRYFMAATSCFLTMWVHAEAQRSTPSSPMSANATSVPNELAQLRDIHLPKPVGWWPLAPGWYMLAAIIAILLLSSMYWIWYRHVQGRAKRRALRLLTSYEQHYQKQRQCALTCAQLSELLKRVALVYYPRQDVASLQGDDWIAFLNRTGKNVDFMEVRPQLLEWPYRPGNHDESCDLTPLFHMTRLWITQRRKPCLS